MLKNLSKIILSFIMIASFSPSVHSLSFSERSIMKDSIFSRLSHMETPADSLPLLFDAYDLTMGKERIPFAEQIYHTATNANNDLIRIEALQIIANLNSSNDSILSDVLSKLESIPYSPERKSARLFTTMLRIDNMVVTDPTEKQAERLLEFSRKYNDNPPSDPFDTAALLYAICRYLGIGTQGELLMQYTENLEELIDSMNLPGGAVKRLVYNRVARYFLDNDEYEKAIESDKKLLESIDSLEIHYADQGRHFRNAPAYRYNCYRRILSSYPVLTPDQVEEYYNQILALTEISYAAKNDFDYYHLPEIYYDMATGRYKEAIPLIRDHLTKSPHDINELSLYKMLSEAAEKTGDKETLYDATAKLNGLLQARYNDKKIVNARELQLVYNMNELKQRNNKLELDRQESSLRARTTVLVLVTTLVILLIMLMVVLIYQRRKQRRAADILRSKNESLRHERDELRQAKAELTVLSEKARLGDKVKTDFINNMSHEVSTPLRAISEYTQLIVDCIPDEKSHYLDRFATIIRLNVKMVLNLVGEILDIASAENKNLSMDKHPSRVRSICDLALADVFDMKASKKNVELMCNPEELPDLVINTDGQRVTQILVNLLNNALKFTDEGHVSMEYHLDQDKLIFTVTDTGIGIPHGKEEAIFDRFRQLDTNRPGCGLGLYVSRLIATLLGGTLILDTTYHGGSRFVLTIPA